MAGLGNLANLEFGNNKCRFQQCAYSHEKNEHQSKVEKLEKEVNELKLEVEELKKNKTDTNNKVTSLSEQTF